MDEYTRHVLVQGAACIWILSLLNNTVIFSTTALESNEKNTNTVDNPSAICGIYRV